MIDVPVGVRVPALLRSVVDPDLLADTIRALWRLPKVELHLHLEGSLRPETVCELASRHEPDSPLCRPTWQDGYWAFRDLAGFVLALGPLVRVCIRRPEDYYRVAVECFEDLAAQQVVYAEVSFGPRDPRSPYYVPFADKLAAIEQARREVEARTTLRVGLIVGLRRPHLPEDVADSGPLATELVRQAVRARDDGAAIVGIDLHGDEQTAPSVDPFVPAFRTAAEAGLGLRAHAGEGSGPGTVWDSIRRLGVQRIGHGVRAVEDPALVTHLAESGLPLDVCPTSNVLTGAAPTFEGHPIRALHAAGVAITVSSDDPLVFATTVTAELAVLHHVLGFSLAELGDLTAQAAAHAFLPELARASLVRRVKDG